MAIELRIFKAKAGVEWMKAGWQLFKIQPGTFIGMQIVLAAVSLIAFVIPFLQIPAALATPFLTAGMYKAMLMRQQGQSIELADMFKPFVEAGRRVMLFRLGLYHMAAGLLLAMLSTWLFQDALALLEQNTTNPELLAQEMVNTIQLPNVVVMVAAVAVYSMCFAYTIPLIYFTQNNSILEAIKASLMVFWHNMAAVAVFHLIASFLFIVAAFASFLPLLIFMPIIYAAYFISFQAMFMSNIVIKSSDVEKADAAKSTDRFDA